MKVATSIVSINHQPWYFARCRSRAKKAILLFPEAFGETGHLKDVAHRFAREGYHVYLFSLYYQINKIDNFQIDYSLKQEREEMLSQLSTQKIKDYLLSTADFFSDYDELISCGFSIGGYFSLLAASLLPITKNISYYPNPTLNNPNHANLVSMGSFLNKIQAKNLLIFGSKDCSIESAEIPLIQKSLRNCEIKIYENASHGFFCNSRHVFRKHDADDSWNYLINFLSK